MKNDIDFDELDKAVNSLMGGVPGTDDDAELQKTLTISTTLQPGENPEYEKLKEVAKGIGDETFVTDSDPDIVKDLGEIASPNAPTTPNESLRAAQSITIPSTSVKTPITSSTPVEPIVPAASSAATPRSAGGRFMDVVHPSSDMRTAPTKDTTLSAPAAAPAPSAPVVEKPAPAVSRPTPTPAPEVHDAATPPLTPFLPDAKVEKRPLGDPLAAPVTVAVSEQSQSDDIVSSPTEGAPEEIVAINSEAKARSAIDTDDQSVLDAAAIITEENNAEVEQLSGIEAEEITPAGSSIQQVESVAAEHEAVSTPAGANMYDVQPLGHPAKRRSGWGIVLIIVIIILVAGALGAGAYFYFGLGT